MPARFNGSSTVHKAALFCIAGALGIGCAAGAPRAETRLDPVLSKPGDTIEFTRHCATERPHQVQAYAYLTSLSGQARALVRAQVGFAGLQRVPSVSAELQALALDAGREWANRSYSLSLAAQPAGGGIVEGAPLTTWHDLPGPGKHGYPEVRTFTANQEGQTRWITFLKKGQTASGFEAGHRLMEPVQVSLRELELQDRDTPVAISVIIRDLESGDEIRMNGPSLRIPEQVWTMEPQVFQVLDLPQTLNPSQEGGLFHALRQNWKYRKCIDERREAKKQFRSFARSASD